MNQQTWKERGLVAAAVLAFAAVVHARVAEQSVRVEAGPVHLVVHAADDGLQQVSLEATMATAAPTLDDRGAPSVRPRNADAVRITAHGAKADVPEMIRRMADQLRGATLTPPAHRQPVTLIVTGDVQPRAIERAVRSAFADWPGLGGSGLRPVAVGSIGGLR